MKACDHVALTRLAIQIFSDFSESDPAKRICNYKQDIIDGSKYADSRPLLDRIKNWHFYRSNDQIEDIVDFRAFFHTIKPNPTSEKILATRIEEFKDDLSARKENDMFDSVGRIIHHIQDMSTPTHVVPVFHGKTGISSKIPDSFEVYSAKYFDIILNEIPEMFFKTKYQDLKSKDQTNFYDTYNRRGQATLKYLARNTIDAKKNGEDVKLKMNMFWSKDPPPNNEKYRYNGFGSFGDLGESFGIETIPVGEDTYEISRTQYDRICADLYKYMINDSLRVLRGVEQLLEDQPIIHS
jgi:hypothetical protein